MELSKKKLVEAAVQAAMRYHERALWRRIADHEPVALRLPGQGDVVVASVMGASGITFGLTLFTGKDALERATAVILSDSGGHEEMLAADHLAVTFDPLAELPPRARRLLDLAGFAGRREKPAPHFQAMPHGLQPRVPDAAELLLLLYSLNALLAADEGGVLAPVPVTAGGDVLTLEVIGDPRRPEVAGQLLTAPSGIVTPAFSPAALPAGLSDLPRRPVRWMAGFPLLPAKVAGDDRLLHGLLVAEDRGSGGVPDFAPIDAHVVPAADMDAVAERFFDLLAGRAGGAGPGLPAEVLFTSRALHALLSPVLALLGVTCRYDPDDPDFEDLAESLRDYLAPGRGPAGSDLGAQKTLQRTVCEMLGREIALRGLMNPETTRAYIGSGRDVRVIFDRMGPLGIRQAYVDWLCFDYVPGRTARTLAGEILRQKLAPGERRILRAMEEAVPFLHEVVAVDPGAARIEVRPAEGGDTVAVHDHSLSGCVRPGWTIPLKIYPAGDFLFCTVAGPAMSRPRAKKASAFLASATTAPEGRRGRSRHAFGRLWAFIAGGPPDPIHLPPLRNSEGHDLLLHEAVFGVADAQAVEEALSARPDIEGRASDGDFAWLGSEDGAGLGFGRTSLGRIRLFPGELFLEVNSRERFEVARAWLLAIPGVTLKEVRTRTMAEEMERDTPLDDRPGEDHPDIPPAEVAEVLRAAFRSHCLAWLDRPVPALGGKTPREACRTPEGRVAVRRLIDEWPPPVVPGGIELAVPKDEMLRELGIPL